MAISKKAHLAVGADSDLVILHPNAATVVVEDGRHADVSHDTVLEGRLIITAPSSYYMKNLRVELIGASELYFTAWTEASQSLNVAVELPALTLEAGTHELAFALTVPASSTPYERNRYGKTEYSLRALATDGGWLGKTVVAQQPITVAVNHNADPSGLPLPFAMDTQYFHDKLGPMKVQLTSRFLLIAGFLQLQVTLPSAAESVRLDDIQVHLKEQVVLESSRKPGYKEEKAPNTFKLRSIMDERGVEAPVLSPGESYSIQDQFRIPIFERISASTAAGSNTGLRISHTLSVYLIYTPLGGAKASKSKCLEVQADCVITACSCLLDILQLPSYQESVASSLPPLKDIGFCSECLCHIADTPKLREMYGAADDAMKQALDWRAGGTDNVPRSDALTGWKAERQRAPY